MMVPENEFAQSPNSLIWYEGEVWPLLLTDPGRVFVCGIWVWDFTTGQVAVDPVGILCVSGGGSRGQSADLWLTCVRLTPRRSGGVRAEDIPLSLTHFPFFIVSVRADTDRRAAASRVFVVCVVCCERDNDRQTAGRDSADGLGPHTHVLSFLLFATQSPSFFFFGESRTSQLHSISLQLSRVLWWGQRGGEHLRQKLVGTSVTLWSLHRLPRPQVWKRWDGHQLRELNNIESVQKRYFLLFSVLSLTISTWLLSLNCSISGWNISYFDLGLRLD